MRVWHKVRLVQMAPQPVASAPENPVGPDWPTELSVWRVFRGTGPLADDSTDEWPRRFRLAGVFVVLTDEIEASTRPIRRAILDDRDRGEQLLVGEGESVGPLRIEEIAADHVVAVLDGRRWRLGLETTSAGQVSASSGAAAEGEAPALEPAPLAESPWGRQVAPERWEMSRDALLRYYEEMLDAPERVALLYQSFVPEYDDNGRISGYRLAIRGEQEFLNAVGLREGDVVRAVNSLNMTSQSRAEYFIREFAQGRLNTVVMDVERDGELRKLVYIIE